MKIIHAYALALVIFMIAACSVSKNGTTSNISTTPVVTPIPLVTAKSTDGVFAPGNEELMAIQVKYKEVTMETLMAGHAIYTGACTHCHEPKSIYKRVEESWPAILDDMSQKAKISDAEKDQVYKYVLAVKATQPNGTGPKKNDMPFIYGNDSQPK